MNKIAEIDQIKCDKSPFCPVLRSCPKNAIYFGKDSKNKTIIMVDSNVCIGCGICTQYCLHNAVYMKEKANSLVKQ